MNIIIIDKSITVRLKIEELLQAMDSEIFNFDLDILSYENATEALEHIQDYDIDLVFSSIETIGMDGISFVESLLSYDPSFASRLFIVTSQTNTENFEDIKGVGAKRFIKKPINEEYFNHFIIPEVNKVIRKSI